MNDKLPPPPRSARHWSRFLPLLMFFGVFIALWLAWQSPALSRWLDPDVLGELGRALLASPFGPLAVLAGYMLAVALAMPMLVMASVGVLVFGPWAGMGYALSGMVLGSMCTYGLGRLGGAGLLDRLADPRILQLAGRLRHEGLWAVIFVRVVPVAPFLMVNVIAGAMRVRLRDFVLGTIAGLLPGTIMLAFFMERLKQAWQSPGWGTWLALSVCAVLIAVASWALRRRLMAVDLAHAELRGQAHGQGQG